MFACFGNKFKQAGTRLHGAVYPAGFGQGTSRRQRSGNTPLLR